MPAQTQPQQDLTISEKMKIVQYISIFPALTIMVFMRRKVGFRILRPSWLIGMAMFLWFIEGLCDIQLPFMQSNGCGYLFDKFPWWMLAAGFLQRFWRWRDLGQGNRWHTYSPGISYFEYVPLPRFLRSHRRIYRFLDPAACFIFSMFFGIFFSQPLARWIAFSSLALFIYEQALYEKQLDRDLDILDGLVAAEVQVETVKHFEGPQTSEQERTIQDTAGIPTGVSFDIQRQIETRRARFVAEEKAASAKAVLPALKAPDNIAIELPPEGMA